MQKLKPVSLSGYLSLGACILLWAGIIAFTSPRHSLVLDTAGSGEIWQGQDLVAPFAFDILRDSVDINQDVTEIKRQFPIPLFLMIPPPCANILRYTMLSSACCFKRKKGVF